MHLQACLLISGRLDPSGYMVVSNGHERVSDPPARCTSGDLARMHYS